MKRCLIWGMGADYDSIANVISFEVAKKNICIQAFVSKDKYCNYFEGKPVIHKTEVFQFDFDYIIICNSLRYSQIKEEAMNIGVKEKRILSHLIFNVVCFDFQRYINLIENPVTIIADDCWGAEAYHYLRLPFSSPFILCYMESTNYIKAMENLDYYLNSPLKIIQESNRAENKIPIASLGEKEKIFLNFNHSVSFQEAKADWEKRSKRINWNNIFIKMTISDEETAERFQKLPYRKAGFYPKTSKWEDIHYLCEWDWNQEYMTRYFGYSYPDYVRDSVRSGKTRSYDLHKLLNGEKGYIRKS